MIGYIKLIILCVIQVFASRCQMEISKSKISRYAQLRNKKFRKEYGLFVAEGHKVVRDTLGSFGLEALVATNGWLGQNEDIVSSLPEEKVFSAKRDAINKISSLSDSPDVIAVYAIPDRQFDFSEPLTDEMYLVIDGVQDPGNLGTIIRTAHWFGLRRVFCSTDCVDCYNPKTVQSTMGSLAAVDVVYCDIEDLMLSNPSLPRYGLQLDGEDIFKVDSFVPGFIIMGREGRGIRQNISALISRSLLIPPADPHNHPDSLNVGVATAITLSQMIK